MDNNRRKPKILYLFTMLFIGIYIWNIDTKNSKNNLKNEELLTKNIEHKQKEIRKKEDPIVSKINELSEKTGIDISGYIEVTFEVSFYSDLNCENGFGNITATGKTLEDGMIANNFLEFGTKIYVEGLGLKTVEDRGSYKYFYNVDKIDVFVPRNYGESDNEYYKRVNNLGRKNMVGYILLNEE